MLKGYNPSQLLLGRDMILPTKHKADWELIRHQQKTKINKDNIRKNTKRADHDYKVGDKVMFANNAADIYEPPYNGQFLIIQYFTNGMVTLLWDLIKIRYNIRRIKPYKSDTNVEYINPKNMYDDANI